MSNKIRTLAAFALLALAAPPGMALESVDELQWLAGNWCGSDGDQQIEEDWLMPAQGESVGMSRTLDGGRMTEFEFMRIVNVDGVVSYIAQPNGEPATSFARSDGGADWVRFENRQHDYPQRIEYRRDGDALVAEIGGPGAAGKEETISYRYQRCPAPAPATPAAPGG